VRKYFISGTKTVRPDEPSVFLDAPAIGYVSADHLFAVRGTTQHKPLKTELAATLPPVIEIVDPAPGASTRSDFLTITYVLRAQGNAPPKVSVQLNGQLMKAQTLGAKLAGAISDQISIPLAGRISSPEFTLSLIAEDDFGASDPASVRLRWGGATTDQAKVRLLVLASGSATTPTIRRAISPTPPRTQTTS
jgi:hypothetical protein